MGGSLFLPTLQQNDESCQGQGQEESQGPSLHQGKGDDALRERDHAITSAVDAIPAEVARLVAPQFAKLRESVNEPRFDCLRISLPEPYLDGLRRPGGSAAAPDR
jgi:hypothetical protein